MYSSSSDYSSDDSSSGWSPAQYYVGRRDRERTVSEIRDDVIVLDVDSVPGVRRRKRDAHPAQEDLPCAMETC